MVKSVQLHKSFVSKYIKESLIQQLKGWLVYICSALHYAFVLCPCIALQWCAG